MLSIEPDSLIQALTVIGLAVIAIIMGYNKLVKDWQTTSAETSVISLMHKELERMSSQNASLSNELGRLHLQVIELNRQLHALNIENQRLQSEVITLTNEVSELKTNVMLKGTTNATS